MYVLDLHPASQRAQAAEILEAIFRGERSVCPLPLARQDGSLVPVETHAWLGRWNDTDCVFSIIKNLSTQQEAQQRFERLFRNNPALMALSTHPEWRFSDVNNAFLVTSGYSREEVIGKTTTELGLFIQPERHGGALEQLLAKGHVADVEMQIRCKDGSVRDGLFWGEVISSQGRKDFLTVMIDVTDRKQAERALARQAQELARSNAELDHFAHAVSHDLNEPLRMVASYMQLLEQRYGGQLDEQAKEYMHFAADGARRMQAMIKAILSLAQVSSQGGKLAPTDCEDVLARVLHSLRLRIDECGAVVTHAPLPTVWADEPQLTRVFQNLIGNAIKFQPAGRTPRVDIGVERVGSEWQFAVRDNGIGIDMRHAQRLFQIFQRLHKHDGYEGTGIGLTLCRRIIERHGGRIWVESQPDEGATFYFTLPVTPA